MPTPPVESKVYDGIEHKGPPGVAVDNKVQYSTITGGMHYYQFLAKSTVPLRDAVRAVGSTYQEMCQLCEVQS